MLLDELARRLEDHEDELRRMHVRTLSVFGSVARGEASRGSDIDLLIEFGKPVGLFHFLRVKQFLEEILGSPVDLVTKRSLKWQVRDRILAEARRVA